MRGIDVFCERCGARQPTERRESAASGAAIARRLRSAVTGTTADGVRPPSNSIFLRLCLECRGYSCPSCWNEEAGICQTCAPMPEPEIAALPQVDVPYVFSEAPIFVHEPEVAPEPIVEFVSTPAVAIEQKTHAGNPRSTIGTMTEIYDYLRILFARLGIAHCPETLEVIRAISKEHVVKRILTYPENEKIQVLAPIEFKKNEKFPKRKLFKQPVKPLLCIPQSQCGLHFYRQRLL